MSLLEKRSSILLANGAVVLVDKIDYDLFCQSKWYSTGGANYQYATRKHKNKHVLMHRLIMEAKKGQYVDHINGNTLDNRRNNLRICTHKENCRNSKLSTRNKTGIKGVHLYIYNKVPCYRAYITVDSKMIYLGYFKNINAAIKARKKAEIKYFKDFRRA